MPSGFPCKWITVADFMSVGRFDQQDYSQFISVRTYVIYKETFQAIRKSSARIGIPICVKNPSYSLVQRHRRCLLNLQDMFRVAIVLWWMECLP